MESFEHPGVWWTPETPEDTAAGVLTYSQDEGLSLVVTGSLQLGDPTSLGSLEVLHGMIKGRGPVSLLDCAVVSSTIGSYPSATMAPRFALFGAHSKGLEKQLFRDVAVESELLQEWAGVRTLDRQVTFDKKGLCGISVGYASPALRRQTVDGTTYLIRTGFATEGDGRSRFEITTSTEIVVRPLKHRRLLNLIREFVRPLLNLLILCTDFPCSLSRCSASMRVPTRGSPRSWAYRRVEVVYQPVLTASSRRRVPMVTEFPLRMADLSGDPFSTIAAWLDLSQQYAAVTDLFFAACQGSGMFSDQRFSYLVQSLEAYHRQRVGGTATDPSAHAERLARLAEDLSREDEAWLMPRLRYTNEPSLRKRLSALLDRVPEVARDLVPMRRRLVQLTLDTRNYLTHYDPRLAAKAASGERLYRLSEVLRYVMSALLVQELDFSSPATHACLKRSRKYEFARSLQSGGNAV